MDMDSLYNEYKSLLFLLAYRMIGSVIDAEEIVRESFVTLEQRTDREKIENKKIYLCKIVINECLDFLHLSEKKRELYVGPWLPEPLLDQAEAIDDPSVFYLQKETLSTAYLLFLQKLNHMGRALFLLREIYQFSFDEVAAIVGKSSESCQEILQRAKGSIRFELDPVDFSVAEAQVNDFVQAVLERNTDHLLEFIREDVICYSDGGGKIKASRIPIFGLSRVLQLLFHFVEMHEGNFSLTYATVNKLPGVIVEIGDGLKYVYSFAFKDSKIATIYTVANPDKLTHV
jgi:RNA polymerase sigma-70 factor (ECF subfamily)